MPLHHAYLRVSTSRQAQQFGFHRQLESIRHYCLQQNLGLDQVWKEAGISGCLLKRPTLDDLLATAQPGDFIYIEDLSRLARKLAVQLQIIGEMIQHGFNLIAVNTGENITDALASDPMQRALVQMQGVFAELERSQLLARMAHARKVLKQDPSNMRKTAAGTPKVEGRQRLTEIFPGLLTAALDLKRAGLKKAQISRALFETGWGDSNGNPLSCTAVRRILQEGA
jgi:DNA invertase Pin-like site-specific DNA recombinase